MRGPSGTTRRLAAWVAAPPRVPAAPGVALAVPALAAALVVPGPACARLALPWPPLCAAMVAATATLTAISPLPATVGNDRRRIVGTLTVTQLYRQGARRVT